MSFSTSPVESLPEILVVEPLVRPDKRGLFFESWHREKFAEFGLDADFVQDNHSESECGVLRGIHYQVEPMAQGKLVRVISGEVFDVAVDLRKSSPTFLRSFGLRLSSENRKMLWIPKGFGHGFYVLSDRASLAYKCTAAYSLEHDRGIRWNDPRLGVDWPLEGQAPRLSAKDSEAPNLEAAELFE